MPARLSVHNKETHHVNLGKALETVLELAKNSYDPETGHGIGLPEGTTEKDLKEAFATVEDFIVNNFAEEEGCNCPAQQAMERIRDRLFLDEDGDEPFYNFDKCDSEQWDDITDLIHQHFDFDTVECSLCGRTVLASEAHLHQDEHIGLCCWDDRLKASE